MYNPPAGIYSDETYTIDHKREVQRQSLYALSRQQGHPGLLEINDVLAIIELRDERIKSLESLLN